MNCRDVRMLLPMLTDLEEEKKRDLLAHAQTCDACMQRLKAWEETCAAMKEMQEEKVPEEFLLGWRNALKEETKAMKGSKRFRGWAAAAAAVVLVVSSGALLSGDWMTQNDRTVGQNSFSYSQNSSEEGMMLRTAATEVEQAGYGAAAYDTQAVYMAGEAEKMESVILKSASLTLQSTHFDETLKDIENLYTRHGGWAQSNTVRGKSLEEKGSGRYASMKLRIPAEALDAFLQEISGYAEVRYKYVSQQDVSDSYYDTQSRLDMYRAQHGRLLELMETAESMEDILSIEARASELQYTIDSLEGNLRHWKSRAEHSDVSIELEEIAREASGEAGIGQRMKAGIVSSWQNVGHFIKDALVFLVSSLPWLAFIGAGMYLISLPVRKWREKRRKNG